MILMKQDLKADIWKFYLLNIFSSFVLYYGIDKIFMEARGLSVTEIVLVEIIFAVLSLLWRCRPERFPTDGVENMSWR